MLQYKNVSNSANSGVIKDIDAKTGTVTGYFSIFGNVDSDGDMIMPGAYKRTLQNNYHRLKHLAFHNSTIILSGTKKGNLVVKEDSVGLYFESKIAPTTAGKDIIISYERGDIDEHSVGFETIHKNKKGSYNELTELKLWEGSTVTWGANELAQSNMKSLTKKDHAKNLFQDLMKAIKSGELDPEEICDSLELTYKQLEQHIDDLTTQPAENALDPVQTVKADSIDTGQIMAFLNARDQLITV